jgi:hypothetical protein
MGAGLGDFVPCFESDWNCIYMLKSTSLITRATFVIVNQERLIASSTACSESASVRIIYSNASWASSTGSMSTAMLFDSGIELCWLYSFFSVFWR